MPATRGALFDLIAMDRAPNNLDWQGNQVSKIKSCYDFMKRGYAANTGERFTRLRRAKISIPAAPISGIFATLRQATGYFGIFATALRAAAPHFRLKEVLIFSFI